MRGACLRGRQHSGCSLLCGSSAGIRAAQALSVWQRRLLAAAATERCSCCWRPMRHWSLTPRQQRFHHFSIPGLCFRSQAHCLFHSLLLLPLCMLGCRRSICGAGAALQPLALGTAGWRLCIGCPCLSGSGRRARAGGCFGSGALLCSTLASAASRRASLQNKGNDCASALRWPHARWHRIGAEKHGLPDN